MTSRLGTGISQINFLQCTMLLFRVDRRTIKTQKNEFGVRNTRIIYPEYFPSVQGALVFILSFVTYPCARVSQWCCYAITDAAAQNVPYHITFPKNRVCIKPIVLLHIFGIMQKCLILFATWHYPVP